MLPLTLALPVALLVLPFAVARAFAVVLQQCTLPELAFCRVVVAWLRSSLFDVVAVTALITWRLGLSHGEGGRLRWSPIWQAVAPVIAAANQLDACRVVDGLL
jgi:hypothetical protein